MGTAVRDRVPTGPDGEQGEQGEEELVVLRALAFQDGQALSPDLFAVGRAIRAALGEDSRSATPEDATGRGYAIVVGSGRQQRAIRERLTAVGDMAVEHPTRKRVR